MTTGKASRITSNSSSSLLSALRMCCRAAHAGSFFSQWGIHFGTFWKRKGRTNQRQRHVPRHVPNRVATTTKVTARSLAPSSSILQENTCKGISKTKVKAWMNRAKHSAKSNRQPSWLVMWLKFRVTFRISAWITYIYICVKQKKRIKIYIWHVWEKRKVNFISCLNKKWANFCEFLYKYINL